uniref:cGMP-dependent protein kinase n=1 Tax=Calcidiscus leptoporus TaxID=127549 RepID=A0A7S0JJA9_9EUKA|mmetsp:Transcript_6879/g.15980  ORF Transcript_6879/g.15980 Transcript_6879/m.15980 type:complete len:1027 (+) Transcript_6879:15-3095(+)
MGQQGSKNSSGDKKNAAKKSGKNKMGACTGKQIDGAEGGPSPKPEQPKQPAAKASAPEPPAKSANDKKSEQFVESIFSETGTEKTLNAGDKLIEQGEEAQKMYFIKDGFVDLVLRGDDGVDMELARRGPGQVLGELSMLLGQTTSSAAVAVGRVVVIEVEQEKLLAMLEEQTLKAGQLFKVVATYTSERISELSSKMRNNVVQSQAAPAQKGTGIANVDIAKQRQVFGIDASQKLIGVYSCSVRREQNAVKEANAHFGDMYIFESQLCFDLKMFAFHKQMVLDIVEIVAFLKSAEEANVVEVQSKGQSVELTIADGFDEAISVMEACRLRAKAAAIAMEQSVGNAGDKATAVASDTLDEFHHMVEPIVGAQGNKSKKKIDLNLKEEDWMSFLGVATQRKYKKGEYVLQEGQATATLFQVVRGTLRVELQLQGQAQAVVVGYRQAGEMLGETSLLKEGRATASVCADADTTVLCIEGRSLEQLFSTKPGLPSRFFCFLASYQANRLYKLTQSFADAKKPNVTIPLSLRLSIEEVMGNPAYCGIIRKYLKKTAEEASGADHSKWVASLHAFDFYVYAQDYKDLPEQQMLVSEASMLATKYISGRSSMCLLSFVKPEFVDSISKSVESLKAGSIPTHEARKIFKPAQDAVLVHLGETCFEAFLGSSHYRYILELKAKESIIPSLDDFKVVRVMGEGGFGQVIETVKRDCGVHYAMKVMQKEMMKQNLGSSWRKKIATEQQLMSVLQHPFLVNLKYAFQNAEFLILVMDIVPYGDLSEFVLTKKRLTPEQVRWAVMEVVEVMSYVHAQNILYRDLKPENLLIDGDGHVRLIDMGLASRITDKSPYRSSRVGTDCYMAPEVRWARRRRTPYGKSADWYTVGVLLYEFSHGALPYSARDTENPIYRGGSWPSEACGSCCESLLNQDYKLRLGCGPKGDTEIKNHPYFDGIDWDIVAACKVPSPMKGVKGMPKKKKDKEMQAQRTAGDIADADRADVDESHHQEYNIESWNFVSPTAITEEYMESVYQCVSSI